MKLDNSEFREELSAIMKQDVKKHHKLLIKLKNKIPHQIVEIPDKIPYNLLGDEFNCFEFALGLIFSKEYKACLDYQKGWKMHPVGGDATFANYLIDNRLLKECAKTFSGSQIIMYFDLNGPAHAGKFKSNIITSKWGRGLLLQHAINEVPSIYGNEARQYEDLNIDDCIDAFIDFAGKKWHTI